MSEYKHLLLEKLKKIMKTNEKAELLIKYMKYQIFIMKKLKKTIFF